MTILVVAGPSGVGKGTILNTVRSRFPDQIAYSISHTTRPRRPGEENGKQYWFVTEEEFQSMQSAGLFLEHVEFSGNLYGTSLSEIRRIADEGKICLIECEMHGVNQIQRSDLPRAKFVFILPPSLEELERRLRQRGTENEDTILSRLATAKREISEIGNREADLRVVNDDLDSAVEQICCFVEKILMQH